MTCENCETHKKNYENCREQRDYLCERLGAYQTVIKRFLKEVEESQSWASHTEIADQLRELIKGMSDD